MLVFYWVLTMFIGVIMENSGITSWITHGSSITSVLTFLLIPILLFYLGDYYGFHN